MAKRKKKKQADEVLVDVVEVREQAGDFFERNQNYIFGALTAIVLVIGGYLAYKNFYVAPRQQEALQQMWKAEEQFARDSFALALTNPGGGYSGFLDIIDQYSGTPAANAAKYYAGICYLHLGQFEAAIDYLKDFDADGRLMPIAKYGALGDAYSELSDFDQAIKNYRKATNYNPNKALTPYYLKKLGMLLEKQGQLEDAKEAYETIRDEYPESTEGRDIEKYIIRIEAQLARK